MNRVHPLIRVGGPILALLILIYVINSAVDTFHADLKSARDAERQATMAAADAESEIEAEQEAEQEADEEATPEAPSQDEESQEEPVLPDVFFRQPTNNAIVPPTFVVKMGAAGVAVDPSGEVVSESGHMHILVDTDFIPAGEIIPTDEQHLHFGDGSLETELTLAPGEHTLHLQFADGLHTALEGDEYRDTIIVFVEEGVPQQSVAFFDPLDGTTATSPFEVVMAATSLVVEPSGEVNEGAGHFHILVNTDFIPAGEIIPTDEQHLHYGQGQTTVTVELEPGEHTLRLQFADGLHTALEGDQYRDTIIVIVEAGQSSEQGAGASEQLAQETIDLAIEAMIRTGCNSCHVTTGLPQVDAAMLGPDQTNLGAIAGTRREGYTAEEYLREAILEPSAFIVEECPLGPCLQVMPETYGDLLSEEELDAIVAYLLSLITDG